MTVTGANMRANILGKVYLIVHCSNLSNLVPAKKHLILCVRLQSHFTAFHNQGAWPDANLLLFAKCARAYET